MVRTQTVEVLHYPTLKTVLMVEGVLKEAKEPVTRYKIMKKLNNKIMLQTLEVVIDYLEERGMVLDGREKGIVWTYTPPQKMKEWLKDSDNL